GVMSGDANVPIDQFVDLPGLRLHFLDWGGEGAPIIILHATGFLGRIYQSIARALAPIGHVYTLDQRGHGDSTRPNPEIYGWELTVRDLEDFILAMGFRQVRALGHSAGATAVGALASRRPDLIARGVLVEPVIFEAGDRSVSGRPDELYERTLRRKRSFDSVEAMFGNFAGKPPYDTWRSDILRDYCEYGTRPDADGKRVLKCLPETEAAIYGSARNFDGLGYLLRCAVPMLVIFGAATNTEGVTLADQIRAPHRRVVIVPGTSHFMPMERPDIVARMAFDFMRPE
ncbi:MAG: alpha/beta fold hydrolase, partial [Candidatus Binataceae bacterium]